VSNPRIAILVGGVTTLVASIPLALRYARRRPVASSAVDGEIADAEPGEVIDFSPRITATTAVEQASLPVRWAGGGK